MKKDDLLILGVSLTYEGKRLDASLREWVRGDMVDKQLGYELYDLMLDLKKWGKLIEER